MAKGSKYWADSYIVLDNGQKFYLEDSIYDIEYKLNSKEKKIKFRVSGWLSYETIYVNKDSVKCYGRV